MDKNAQDLIDKLLDYTPENRIGFKSFHTLKKHSFFAEINFVKLIDKRLQIPSIELISNSS